MNSPNDPIAYVVMPKEIPAAPALPYYNRMADTDPAAVWAESWALGYNAGYAQGVNNGEPSLRVVERERQTLANEADYLRTSRDHSQQALVLALEERDEYQEDYDDLYGKYRTSIYCNIITLLVVIALGVALAL